MRHGPNQFLNEPKYILTLLLVPDRDIVIMLARRGGRYCAAGELPV
jgi:hypothetical protein